MNQQIILERDGQAATIKVLRPEALNAFLRERGSCLPFRVKSADTADRERLTRLLKRTWRSPTASVPLISPPRFS